MSQVVSIFIILRENWAFESSIGGSEDVRWHMALDCEIPQLKSQLTVMFD